MPNLRSSVLSFRSAFPALALAIAGGLFWPSPLLPADPRRHQEPLKIHPSDPHRLSLGGGIWAMAGYYPSLGAFNTDTEDHTLYQRMIDAMAGRGINYFRIAMNMGQPFANSMNPYLRTGPGTANDGRPKFDLTQFDQSFFDYWRSIVEYARARGVIAQICIMDGWHAQDAVVQGDGVTQTWGLKYDYYFQSNNVNGLPVFQTQDLYDPANPVSAYQQALIRKTIDTLGDLPNIVWEIANESGNLPWEFAHADYLTSYERARGVREHLVMPRDLPSHQYVKDHCDNDPARTHAYLVSAYSQDLVLISDNDCTDGASADIRRAKAWAALTAGAQVNFFHFELTSDAVLASEDAIAGMRAVGLQRKFVSDLDIDLAGMTPSDGDVSNGWALGRYGAEYILYLPQGGVTSIFPLASTTRAVWFNPRDGSWFDAGCCGTTFTAPDANDWVLYVRGRQ